MMPECWMCGARIRQGLQCIEHLVDPRSSLKAQARVKGKPTVKANAKFGRPDRTVQELVGSLASRSHEYQVGYVAGMLAGARRLAREREEWRRRLERIDEIA